MATTFVFVTGSFNLYQLNISIRAPRKLNILDAMYRGSHISDVIQSRDSFAEIAFSLDVLQLHCKHTSVRVSPVYPHWTSANKKLKTWATASLISHAYMEIASYLQLIEDQDT